MICHRDLHTTLIHSKQSVAGKQLLLPFKCDDNGASAVVATMSPSSSSHANAEAIISAVDLLSSSNNVRTWLSLHHPKQLATLDLFELELRRGRLSMPASSAVVGSTFSCVQNGRISDQQGMEADRRLITSRTVELLKVLIGQTKWRTGAQLLILLRGLGEELHSAGGFRDPAIGNVVRRIMRCVREEVVTISATSIPLSADDDGDVGPRRRRGLLATKTAPTPKSTTAITDSSGRTSLANMLWAHPQHIVPLKKSMSNITTGAGGSIGAGAGSNASENRRIRSESAGSSSSSSILDHRGRSAGGSQQDCHMSLGTSLPPSFHVNRSDLRQAVMEAIQEVQSELEDVHTVINDQATSHIHADEVILIYGRSKTVELVSCAC